MPQPHEFGFIQDEEDWEEEEMDLSGWMSRSPPDNGFGSYQEPPMLEEPPVRARATPRSNAHTSAQFTPPMQGIAGTPGFISKESAFNPFWVSDAAYFPKATLGLKVTGFSALVTGLTFYVVGRNAHKRAEAQVNETHGRTYGPLEFAAPIAKKLAMAGLMGYIHPVIGMNHGLLKNQTGTGWSVGKYMGHGLLLIGGVAILRRV